MNFIADGSDGTGLKTEVLWFRFADQERCHRLILRISFR
jgi:hypothetical protein